MPEFDKTSQFLKSNAAAMRALAGGKNHQVTYAGADTHVGNNEVRLPALPPTATAAQRNSLRGAADGAALWLSHHDPKIHQKHCPVPEGAKSIFEAAERLLHKSKISLLPRFQNPDVPRVMEGSTRPRTVGREVPGNKGLGAVHPAPTCPDCTGLRAPTNGDT